MHTAGVSLLRERIICRPTHPVYEVC